MPEFIKNIPYELIIQAVIIFAVFYLISVVINILLKRASKRYDTSASEIFRLLSNSQRALLLIVGSIIAIGKLGFDMSALIAGLGLSGFALGLALKDTISNLVAGIMIVLYKPFEIGSELEISGSCGTVIDINAVIHNLGDVAEVNVPVAFYLGDPNNGGIIFDEKIIPGPVPAGDSTIVSASWSVPEVNEAQEIYVVIDPNFDIEDSDRSNNIAAISVMSADLTVASISSARIGPKMRGITAKIKNVGGLPAESVAVSIRKEAQDGPQLASFNIDQLGPNASYDVWHVWDIAAQDFNDVEVALYVIADANDTITELDEDDNIGLGLVQVGKVADVTDNGKIDLLDFAKFANSWMDSCLGPEWCQGSDFNQTQKVDYGDLKRMGEQWLWQASWYRE